MVDPIDAAILPLTGAEAFKRGESRVADNRKRAYDRRAWIRERVLAADQFEAERNAARLAVGHLADEVERLKVVNAGLTKLLDEADMRPVTSRQPTDGPQGGSEGVAGRRQEYR